MVQLASRTADETLAQIASLFDARYFSEAAAVAHRALVTWPDHPRIFTYLAESCLKAGYIDEAALLFNHLLGRERSTFALVGSAITMISRGQMDEARGLLREAIKAAPGNAQAWTALAHAHTFRKDDPLITKLKKQLLRKDLTSRTRRELTYTMCEILNQTGQWVRAWDHAVKAAQIDTPAYDPAGLAGMIQSADHVFTPQFCAPRPARGVHTDAPIFVVGMPRSGTTLVSMILSMVNGVEVMGELTRIPKMAAEAAEDDAVRGHPPSHFGWLTRWQDAQVTNLAKLYLADVQRRAGGTLPARFVDKLPANVLHLGQIACMFPRARIVRVIRDPLDTCVSCFLGRFGNGNTYTYRMDWLADAYRRHIQAGDMLMGRIPNPVYTVRYEDLVSNPSHQVGQLLDALDLPWTEACLTPQKSTSATTTRSVSQVREPISAGSVGRWQRYGDRVLPLAEALGIDLSQRPAA